MKRKSKFSSARWSNRPYRFRSAAVVKAAAAVVPAQAVAADVASCVVADFFNVVAVVAATADASLPITLSVI